MGAPDLWAAGPAWLARASAEGVLLALLVGGACRLWPALPAAARAALWWAVSLKLLVGLLPLPAIEVPVLPAAARRVVEGVPGARDAARRVVEGAASALDAARGAAPSPAPATRGGASFASPATPAPAGPAAGAPDRLARPAPAVGAASGGGVEGRAPTFAGASWGRALFALWLGGIALQAAALACQIARWRELVRRARPAPAALQSLAAALSARLGLARCPPLLLSDEARMPQVGGVLRPAVIVPAAAALSGDELAMVLCHELAHVRRRDLLFGWAPALAERAFFFHPAAWVAAREYALAREAACDRIVLDALGAAPREYGRLIVRLGVGAGGARLAAAGASPTARLLKRRLTMLQHEPSPHRLLPLGAIALATLAACLPLDLAGCASPARPAPPASAARASAPPPPAPAATPPAEGDAADSAGGPDERDEPAEPEERAQAGAAPGDRARPRAGRREHEGTQNAWVFFDTKGGRETASFMHGSSRDIEAARRARGSKTGPMLYVRRGDRAYVITDPATLESARAIMAPQRELGRQQEELGRRQGALGERQGKLGERQGKLGERQGRAGAELAAVAMKLASEDMARAAEELRRRPDDASGRAGEARERARRARDEYHREAGNAARRQSELARQQSELGRAQAELGREQATLGREQARLGERQREAALRAERELDALLGKAIAAGTAAPAR